MNKTIILAAIVLVSITVFTIAITQSLIPALSPLSPSSVMGNNNISNSNNNNNNNNNTIGQEQQGGGNWQSTRIIYNNSSRYFSPDIEISEAVDRRNREIADGDTTPIPYMGITFASTDVATGIDRTECSLDGRPFTSCTNPVVYNRLSRGTHEVTVRATDAAGNTGEDEFTWTVGNPPTLAPGRQ